jgi:hypothetical protein
MELVVARRFSSRVPLHRVGNWTLGSLALTIGCGSCGTSSRNASATYPLYRHATFRFGFRRYVGRLTQRWFLQSLPPAGVIHHRVTRRT